MKNAGSEIIEILRANKLLYYCSIAEKQNETGIMFNDRLFFLLSAHHIGYISAANAINKPQKIDFQKAKSTVVLTDIRNIIISEKQLEIKFTILQNNNRIQKKWVWRFSTEQLSRLWYDLLQKEKIDAINLKQNNERALMEEQKPQPKQQKEKKPFELVSKNMELVQNHKKQIETKQVGTSFSPRNSLAEKNKPKIINYEEELSKIINDGSSSRGINNQNISQFKEIDKSKKGDQLTNRTQIRRDGSNSMRSQPPFKRAQYLQRQYLDLSRQQSSKSGSIKKDNRLSPPSSKKVSPSESPPIVLNNSRNVRRNSPALSSSQKSNNLSNKMYYDEKNNNESLLKKKDYYKQTQRLVKNSEVDDDNQVKNYFEKLMILHQLEKSEINRQIQNSPKVHKFQFSPLKQKATSLPWTYKYVKYNHLIFQEFKSFTQQLMKDIIIDLNKKVELQKMKPKLIKNNIMYFQIDDIEVKLALIGLQNTSIQQQGRQNQKGNVCNKNSVKLIQNQFNNFKTLYQYLGNKSKLRVPLVSLCQFQGFVALFKILSRNINRLVQTKDLAQQLDALRYRSKIQWDFTGDINKVVVQLDDFYYDKLKSPEEKNLDFRLYFIQEIDDYLLPDLITDLPQSKTLVVRKQLIQGFRTQLIAIKNQSKYPDQIPMRQNTQELHNLSRQILKTISEAISQLQSLSIFFMTSAELSNYFHSKGINLRYLGHIHQHLKSIFQKRILMSEIAARSCKILLRKTIQDIYLDDFKLNGQVDLQSKLCDFFNCIFGNTYQTAQIWKVLSFHSQRYFGIPLNFSQISRGYFMIAIVQNCRLRVNWNKILIQQAFKSNDLFNPSNLSGINYHHKLYTPFYSEQYNLASKIIALEESYQAFEKLAAILNIKIQQIPNHLKEIQMPIKKYLAYFISPQKAYNQDYAHLNIYQSVQQCPSRIYFDILLTQIKWNLKLSNKQAYIRNCDHFIGVVTKYYGQFHPIFSKLYELFSAYYLTTCEFQDAITFAKSSLVNILKICGTNHQKTSECYYHLALCYIQANKREEAISHIKKSKQFFENNQKTQTIAYAVMSIKLGLLFLNQNMIQQSLDTTKTAINILEIFQQQNQTNYQDYMTECYEILTRCYQIVQDKESIRQIALNFSQKLKNISTPKNLQKMLKIYLYAALSELRPQIASCYIDIISLLPIQITDSMYFAAFQLLKARLQDDTFFANFHSYLEKLISIQIHINERQIIKKWRFFDEVYPRQTVKDFVSLTTEMLAFLGEGFVVGTLREAL